MGIKADVWIGNTTLEGSKTTIEWYFIDSSWASQLPTPLLIQFKFFTNSQVSIKNELFFFTHALNKLIKNIQGN